MQIVSFIDTSSGVNTAAGVNRNIYFVASFSNTVRASTGVFLSNVDRQVSRLVEQQLVSRGGSINLAAGLDALAAEYATVTVSLPAFAVLVAAGSSSRTAAVAAAARVRASFGGALSLACIPLGSAANVETLEAIAGTGLRGEALVYETPLFGRIGVLLQRGLTAVGAIRRPQHPPPTRCGAV